MHLTKDDLSAIGELIDEKLEKKLGIFEKNLEAKFEARLEEKISPLRVDIHFMQFQLEGLKMDFAGLKVDIVGFRHEPAGFKHEVMGIKVDVASLKTDVVALKTAAA